MQGQNMLLCKATVLSIPAQFSSLEPWKLGSGSFLSKLSSLDLLCCIRSPTHWSPITGRQWFLICVSLSWGSSSNTVRRCCSQEHWHVREDSTQREAPSPSTQPKCWPSLPSRELALQACWVSSTTSLQARLHKFSEEVSMGQSTEMPFFPASDPVLTFCPWGKSRAVESKSHQELELNEERNSTEHKKETEKTEGAKQVKM